MKYRYNYHFKNTCLDCGCVITNKAKRCSSCAQKSIRNSNYKNGKTKIDGAVCIDCGKPVTYVGTKCKSCAKKGIKNPEHSKRISGINHPNYIDGRSLQSHYCIDCGKLLVSYQNVRCKKCYDKKHSLEMKGEKNPSWQGGISDDPYPVSFNLCLKNLVKIRDRKSCKICGISEQTSFHIFGRKLSIHHIDNDKNNSNLNNLITVCQLCHHSKFHHGDSYGNVLLHKMQS